MKIGINDITLKVGSAYVSAAYLGNTKVYPNSTPTFSGLTVYYNITDISQPTELFNGGGALPSAMIIDGTAVEVTNTYQFSTTGEHIVNYSFADNQIPNEFLYDDESTGRFSTVTKVEIGDTLTIIGENAFNGCSSLTSCTIGSGVTSIGESAFFGCHSLTSIDIPSGVTSIGYDAFGDCHSLTSIDIPSGVTSIGDYVFYGCSGLTSCTIGSGVTSIDAYAFDGCSSLTSIVSNVTTAPTIQSSTFNGVGNNGTLRVPIGSSGYDTWMQNANYYLGLYNWTKVEQ